MWLLSTDRAELHYFSSSDAVQDGYAILSHTWEGQEQSHQDVLAIGARCSADGTNPRDFVCSKIHQSCVLAESHGFRWIWIDSCCIDKTSSTELSEAINSMFRWYAQAEVCYAYLADVPSGSQLTARTSAFRKSRWHTRGWTLQELLAPAIVVFMSGDWQMLGTKANLAGLLQDVTGIDQNVLTREVRLSSCSISVRMCWASRRNTTRVEDEAYCLMGLFDVSMPTIYGEGRRAFLRLQYEIMRHSSDISLFAWFNTTLPGCGKLSSQRITFLPGSTVPDVDPAKYLLAPSPQHFVHASHYTPNQGRGDESQQAYPPYNDVPRIKAQPKGPLETGPFDRIELPRIAVTSYGVECRLPIFEAHGITVAVLLCRLLHGDEHLGLILTADSSARDPTRRRYHVGARYRDDTWTNIGVLRLVSLGTDFYNLRFDGGVVQAQWRTVHIVPAPPDWASPEASVTRFTLNCGADPPFRLPHTLISRFVALDFTPIQTTVKSAGSGRTVNRIVFDNRYRSEVIYLDLGLCSRPGSQQDGDRARWARAMIGSPAGSYGFDHPDPGMHDCTRHHIDLWEGRAMAFGGPDRTVRLSFAPCKVMPETTVVVHIELTGSAYEDMLRAGGVTFPPLRDPGSALGPPLYTPSTTTAESLELSVRSSTSDLPLPSSPSPSTPRAVPSAARASPVPDIDIDIDIDIEDSPSPLLQAQQDRGSGLAAVDADDAEPLSSQSGTPGRSASYVDEPLESDTTWILDGIPPEDYAGSEVWA